MNMLHIWYFCVPLCIKNTLNTYFDVIQAIENFLELHEVQNVMKNQFFSKFLSLQISFLISIKSQKVACGHVFMHKNCLKNRITTSFTSACTYGPKHVSNIIFECCHYIKKFWREPEGTSGDLQNWNFLDTSSWFSLSKWFSIHYLSKSLNGDVFAMRNCARLLSDNAVTFYACPRT